MAATEEERQAATTAWVGWFGGLGQAVVDHGNPFGPAATVTNGGSVSDGATSAITGYSVVSADTLAAASALAKELSGTRRRWQRRGVRDDPGALRSAELGHLPVTRG